MIEAELEYVDTKTVVRVSGAPPMTDRRFNRFTPDEVTFAQRSDLGLYWIGVRGHKEADGTVTDTGFSVTVSCRIISNERSSVVPPTWLDEMVERFAAGHFRPGVVPPRSESVMTASGALSAAGSTDAGRGYQ